MYVDLGRVQHRLEVRVVEGDGLLVVLDRLVELALEGCDVAEQIVGLGGLRVDLERAPGRELGAARIAALYEIPTAVEVGRELVHGLAQLLTCPSRTVNRK